MSAYSKKGKTVTQSARTKMLCPHCGNDDFAIVKSRMSWLLGQRFKCAKCGGIFKQANVVKVREKSKEYSVDQTGTKRKPKTRKTRRK